MDDERYRAILADLQRVTGSKELAFDERGTCAVAVEGTGTVTLYKDYLLASLGVSLPLDASLPDPLPPGLIDEVLVRALLAWDGDDCMLTQSPDRVLTARACLPLRAWEQEGAASLLERFCERALSLATLLKDEESKADAFRTDYEHIPSFALRV